MQQRLIIYLYFCLLCQLHGAEVKWLDVTNKKAYRLDIRTQILEQEISPDHWKKAGSIKMIGVDEKDLSTPLRFICLQADKKHLRYLLADCTQQVYQFDFEKMLLERIDATFYRGFNCFSTRFIRKGVIYSFGGYGMFRTNNLMTHYQHFSKEWIAIQSVNDAPKSIHNGMEGYHKQRDVFYSGLNLAHSPSENNGKLITDYYFYEYSFKNNEWRNVGLIDNEALKEIPLDHSLNYYWNGKYFIVRNYNLKNVKNTVTIIDPTKNEVYVWHDKELFLDRNLPNREKDFDEEYVIGDTLYRRRPESVTKKETFIQTVSIEKMKKEADYAGKLYTHTDNNSLYYFLALAVSAALVIFLIRKNWLKKRKKEAQTFSFENDEKRVLDVLLTNDTGLTTDEINDLLNLSHKTIDNQRKLRNEFLKALNLKLYQMYEVKDAIERITLELDKRMVKYVLNSAIREKLRT
jgi:low affinity Fe/Cu permease